MSLANQFAAYSEWRSRLSAGIGAFQAWLSANDLSDQQSDLRLAQLLERLREDRLNVAFVAEFSRGKSELINAIFFADYGSRMLPSSPGRTTMCPTELLYDAGRPPCIELLPIQTRASNVRVGEYRRHPEKWARVPLPVDSPAEIQAALRHVSQTIRVARGEAERLGFELGEGVGGTYRAGSDGLVEIPRWRHAVINFPHPLLKQGLVILDTPGLNAIGAEPELTLSLLPKAHAVLFILAADTGVTQSDLAIWKERIGDGGTAKRGRMVVLNKIDGQWDELKSVAEVDADIRRMVSSCATTLGLPERQIFPVSAQKGLVGKVNGDAALLQRSRLPVLEAALSSELIQAKREIVYDNTDGEFGEVSLRVRGLLELRLDGLREQLAEMTQLRGTNKGVVEYMMGKVRAEKSEFEAALRRYYAVRSVFTTLSNNLFGHLGLDTLRQFDAGNPRDDARGQFLEDAVRHDAGLLLPFAPGAGEISRRDRRDPGHDGGGLQEVLGRARPQARYAGCFLAAPLPKRTGPPGRLVRYAPEQRAQPADDRQEADHAEVLRGSGGRGAACLRAREPGC